jgi:hypothetical protein
VKIDDEDHRGDESDDRARCSATARPWGALLREGRTQWMEQACMDPLKSSQSSFGKAELASTQGT